MSKKNTKNTKNIKNIKNIKRIDFLQTFAKTGHDSLKAILIVSGGATVAFLAFLGSILANPNLTCHLNGSIDSFKTAIVFFIFSIMLSLMAYAFSFASHAFYYLRLGTQSSNSLPQDAKCFRIYGGLGFALTLFGVIAELCCITLIVLGGFKAVAGLGYLGNAAITTVSPQVVNKTSTKDQGSDCRCPSLRFDRKKRSKIKGMRERRCQRPYRSRSDWGRLPPTHHANDGRHFRTSPRRDRPRS